MSKERFNNALVPTVEQQEAGRVFLSDFEDSSNDFLAGDWFNILIELSYFALKGESFWIADQGMKRLKSFDSMVKKNILSYSVQKIEKDLLVTIVDFNFEVPFITDNIDVVEQAIREIDNGTRALRFTCRDRDHGKLHTANNDRLLRALA